MHQIRRAKDHIYIETQYFLGSSFMWSEHQDSGCYHVIPAEIAHKIARKIHEGLRFCAYIVVPLHPEGNPVRALTTFAVCCGFCNLIPAYPSFPCTLRVIQYAP